MAPDSAPSQTARLQAPAELASAGRQAWEVISGWLGRDGDGAEVTLLFTELCGFSSWVLETGDERALELLREVATVVERCITARRGKVVKRLGHGHMAVFPHAADGVEATLAMQGSLTDGDGGPGPDRHPEPQPRLRAGLHLGHPQRVDGDYLGADVNIAARIAEAARAGEVLVSGEVLEELGLQERERLRVRRRRAFRAKGAPPGQEVFCVTPLDQG